MMIHATTELALRKLFDDRKDEVIGFRNGKWIVTNKLRCDLRRLVENMKEVEELERKESPHV